MLIDCDSCVMRDTDACGDCVVTALLDMPEGPIVFDGEQARVISLFQDGGLLPQTRFRAAGAGSRFLAASDGAGTQCPPRAVGEDCERAAAGGVHR
jgi:hypothetical protein